jgi:putative flippase GtrA
VRYAGLYFVIANLAAIGLALIWNFTANLRWTWRPTREPPG